MQCAAAESVETGKLGEQAWITVEDAYAGDRDRKRIERIARQEPLTREEKAARCERRNEEPRGIDRRATRGPRFEAPALADAIREEMSGAMELRVPLNLDVASGANWLEAK